MLRAIRGLRDGPPRDDARQAGGRWALASAITLLFFAVLGSAVVSVRDLLEPERSASGGPAPPPERIVFVPVPRSAGPERPVAPPPPTLAPASRPGPAAPIRRPATVDTSAASEALIAPPLPRQSDSSTLAPPPSSTARSTVADPRAVFPTAGCDLACRVGRVGRVGRDGGGGAGGVGGGSLTAAERDSLRREAGRRAQAAQRQSSESPVGPTAPSTGAPVQQQGGSVAVPLPGGGPSAAERKRNRELDAEVSARLRRIRARADSVQRARDSVERKP